MLLLKNFMAHITISGLLCIVDHVCSRRREIIEEGQMMNLTTSLKNKKNKVNKNGKMFIKPVTKEESKCFSCKENKGHMKKNFAKFKNWLENKVIILLCLL